MTELGQTDDPRRLVPGDPSAVVGTMWAMRSYGDSLQEAGTGLARLSTDEGWRGEAAAQFRARFHGQPDRWLDAGRSFHDAANALDTFATRLQWGQDRARDAVATWQQGQSATSRARQEYDARPPSAPFVDPGNGLRDGARAILDEARRAVRQAGDAAAITVVAATQTAPELPGFWSKVGDFLGDVGEGLEEIGKGLVNTLASVGNAMIEHPGDVALLAGGVLLTGVSAGGDGLGVALDATGVGAVAGVPLNIVSTAGVVAGAGIVTVAGASLLDHAITDSRVEVFEMNSGSGGSTVGRAGTKTDRLKEHLTDRDLDAARRELNGETVATKSTGQPWDHVDEVRNAQRGLTNRIDQLKRLLGDSRISDADRAAAQSELSEASRLLDYSEQFVPRV